MIHSGLLSSFEATAKSREVGPTHRRLSSARSRALHSQSSRRPGFKSKNVTLTMPSSNSFESLNTRVSQLFAHGSFTNDETLTYAKHFAVQEYKQVENTEAVEGKTDEEIAELVKVKVFEHLEAMGMA